MRPPPAPPPVFGRRVRCAARVSRRIERDLDAAVAGRLASSTSLHIELPRPSWFYSPFGRVASSVRLFTEREPLDDHPPPPPLRLRPPMVARCKVVHVMRVKRALDAAVRRLALPGSLRYTIPFRLALGRVPVAGPPAARTTPSHWPTVGGAVRARAMRVERALGVALAHTLASGGWQCYTLPFRLALGRAPFAGPPAAHATPSCWPTVGGAVRARAVCVERALDAARPGIFLAGSRARAFCRPARRPRRHPSLADECAAGRGYVAPSLGSTPPWPNTSSCWLALRARWTRRFARPRSISSTRSRLRPTERVPICTHFCRVV